MANDVQTANQPAVTELVKGIVNDIGALIRQEVRFARAEVKSDLRKTRTAVACLASGASIASLGGVLLALMLVYLLHWLTIPVKMEVPDPGRIPLWGCYGLVSLLFFVVGGGLIALGIRKFESFNPLPDETIKSVEENVSWITNSK